MNIVLVDTPVIGMCTNHSFFCSVVVVVVSLRGTPNLPCLWEGSKQMNIEMSSHLLYIDYS